ncbi:MAG TPA: extracellular solute-binding protein [Gaiella sp.]|jgi:iron(III) transport system substrate-binding protein|nr:extracellular solute-binding protein [Gaiella sp.]
MTRSRRRLRLVAVVAVLVLGVVAAFAATGASGNTSAVSPYTAAQWNSLVAKAKQEGSVTVYSSEHPVYLQDLANKFKERYGITVTVNRAVDNVLVTQVTAEHGTGNVKADLWISASKPQVLGALKNGWVADAKGPSFFMKRYDRTRFAKPGKAFAVGTAVLAIGWNSRAVPQGIKDYPGFLNQSLAGGKIGVPDPKAAPAFIDFYLWLQENYGANYLSRLAALKPKIYVSTLPMQQAMTSGEIAATILTPATTRDLKAQGAPVDFAVPPKGAWNAVWFGMVLKKAPHPNAAQLLADYFVTPEGQGLVHKSYGSVLKGVPGTFWVPFREQKLNNFTAAKVKAFNDNWDRLFR